MPAGRRAVSLRIAGIDDFRFTKNVRLHLEDAAWPDSIRYGFVELRDAVVTPFGFVVVEDALVFDAQILPNNWMRGEHGGLPDLVERVRQRNFIHKLDPWSESAVISLPDDLAARPEPAFLFNSRLACFNFAHLFHDTLIQAPTYGDACAAAGAALTPVLAGPGLQARPVWADLLRRALGEAAPFFLRGEFHKFARLYVPTTHFAPSQDAVARGAVHRLARRLGASLASLRAGEPRRLFISRADSGRGDDREPRFANGSELEAALTGLGFETIVASRLDPGAYLKTFVNSEIVVGLHGAGLMNAALSATPRLVEITVPGYPAWNDIALFVGGGLGAPYRRLVMPEPRDGLARYDVPAVVAAAQLLLDAPCPRGGVDL